MKNQALFSSIKKKIKLKCRLLQFLFGALRVKTVPLFEGLLFSRKANRKSQKFVPVVKMTKIRWCLHIFCLIRKCYIKLLDEWQSM